MPLHSFAVCSDVEKRSKDEDIVETFAHELRYSGITNEDNLWATETMGNPKYPQELFRRVVTVGLETMKVVNGLLKLDTTA